MKTEDHIKVLKTLSAHRQYLVVAMEALAASLTERARLHDLSKFSDDEFSGFARINAIAREHPYGSDEYKQSLAQEKETIELHYSRNSHHPEFHGTVEEMGFLDIVEMVCDWWSARHTYGKSQPWEETLRIQRERFGFTDGQWWLVEQLAAYLQAYEERSLPSG